MRHQFWDRWHNQYLSEQISRTEWKTSWRQNDIKIGTVVVIKEGHQPPMTWEHCQNMAVYPGQDGIIRKVFVQSPPGNFERALQTLYPLPINHK